MRTLAIFMALAGVIAADAAAQQATREQAVKACGPATVDYEVKVDKKNHPLATPEPGKALVYFIEQRAISCFFCGKTIRFGVDGSWAGANHDDSYFYVQLAPGEHHLCASRFSDEFNSVNTALNSFTAEAGKTYYFIATIGIRDVGDRGTKTEGLHFDAVNPDQGQFFISLYGLRSFHQ